MSHLLSYPPCRSIECCRDEPCRRIRQCLFLNAMCHLQTGESGAVYCGKSAGAIIAGDDVSTATWKGWDDPTVVPNRDTYEDWIGTKGLQFADSASYFPHMSDDWIELVNDKVKGKKPDSTCCLRENEVCCITGESRNTFVVSGPAPES